MNTNTLKKVGLVATAVAATGLLVGCQQKTVVSIDSTGNPASVSMEAEIPSATAQMMGVNSAADLKSALLEGNEISDRQFFDVKEDGNGNYLIIAGIDNPSNEEVIEGLKGLDDQSSDGLGSSGDEQWKFASGASDGKVTAAFDRVAIAEEEQNLTGEASSSDEQSLDASMDTSSGFMSGLETQRYLVVNMPGEIEKVDALPAGYQYEVNGSNVRVKIEKDFVALTVVSTDGTSSNGGSPMILLGLIFIPLLVLLLLFLYVKKRNDEGEPLDGWAVASEQVETSSHKHDGEDGSSKSDA